MLRFEQHEKVPSMEGRPKGGVGHRAKAYCPCGFRWLSAWLWR